MSHQPQHASRKRITPRRVLTVIAAALVGVVALAVIGINIYVHVAFGDFYQRVQAEAPIPGINSGFVPQDIDYMDKADLWLHSGYSADGSESPLYKVAADGSTQKVFVNLPDGSPYIDHGSAITTTDEFAFLACEGGYLVLNADDIVAAEDGDHIDAIDFVALDFTPAFMNIEMIDGEYELLVGNFYFPEDYETPAEHRITTPDGSENPAVLYAYHEMEEEGRYGFAETPMYVLSIPGMIQGACVVEDPERLWLVLSSSYGLSTSHLTAYDLTAFTEADGTFMADGEKTDLYCLDSRTQAAVFDTPPMAEGIESHEGRVWVPYESASNKYVFGKLYGSGEVYSLEL